MSHYSSKALYPMRKTPKKSYGIIYENKWGLIFDSKAVKNICTVLNDLKDYNSCIYGNNECDSCGDCL